MSDHGHSCDNQTERMIRNGQVPVQRRPSDGSDPTIDGHISRRPNTIVHRVAGAPGQALDMARWMVPVDGMRVARSAPQSYYNTHDASLAS